MADKQVYDVLVPEEYEDKRGGNGELKSRYYRVGTAFENERDGMSVILAPGITVSGKLVIMPRREKDNG